MYELSRDYERAWELIQQGDRLACWLDYHKEIRDVAYACLSCDSIRIGARGISYIYLLPEEITLERFKVECESLNIEFYLPISDNMIVISREDFEALKTPLIQQANL